MCRCCCHVMCLQAAQLLYCLWYWQKSLLKWMLTAPVRLSPRVIFLGFFFFLATKSFLSPRPRLFSIYTCVVLDLIACAPPHPPPLFTYTLSSSCFSDRVYFLAVGGCFDASSLMLFLSQRPGEGYAGAEEVPRAGARTPQRPTGDDRDILSVDSERSGWGGQPRTSLRPLLSVQPREAKGGEAGCAKTPRREGQKEKAKKKSVRGV